MILITKPVNITACNFLKIVCYISDIWNAHAHMYTQTHTKSYIYRILLSNHPWVLENNGPKNGCGRLHSQAICMYNTYIYESSKRGVGAYTEIARRSFTSVIKPLNVQIDVHKILLVSYPEFLHGNRDKEAFSYPVIECLGTK